MGKQAPALLTLAHQIAADISDAPGAGYNIGYVHFLQNDLARAREWLERSAGQSRVGGIRDAERWFRGHCRGQISMTGGIFSACFEIQIDLRRGKRIVAKRRNAAPPQPNQWVQKARKAQKANRR
ncbi:MAG: hypothetical protein ACKV2V_05775 [Blastocatellia bacterium]